MYHFSVQLDGSFDNAIERVTAALKDEGFGVLTEIDIQATLKKKLGIDKRPYKILGACNPPIANKALDIEPDIGLLLPCNVVVREEEDSKITVSFMNPMTVLNLADHHDINELAKDAHDILKRVSQALG